MGFRKVRGGMGHDRGGGGLFLEERPMWLKIASSCSKMVESWGAVLCWCLWASMADVIR